MQIFLDRWLGSQNVRLLGEDYTGNLVVWLNSAQTTTVSRDEVGLLAERLVQFLDSTANCPRCQHSRVEHFRLWTAGGHLEGCSHGTREQHKLADGLPCDCPGPAALSSSEPTR